jgi:L-alanine-DL-glutamate epimerase-like enolase superfamily enzyme
MPHVTIDRVSLRQVNLPPKVLRTDAIQSFVTQETILLTLHCSDGINATGYAYTIGTGGSSVIALLKDHLAPCLIGRNPVMVEAIWKDLFFHTHATAVGAMTSLALACVDTALWDWRAQSQGLPLWQLLGGAQARVPLCAVRDAVGPGFELMTDANQGFNRAEVVRRARAFDGLGLAWIEEPLPAEDVSGHRQLREHTTIPVAVGESMYHPMQFREYLEQGACSIVQPDVARIGGITPWIKTAHLAETFDVAVCPHFLMEVHVSLCAAVPNATWVEYIPQLDDITTSRLQVQDGYALPPETPGLGIAWDWAAIEQRQTTHMEIQAS